MPFTMETEFVTRRNMVAMDHRVDESRCIFKKKLSEQSNRQIFVYTKLTDAFGYSNVFCLFDIDIVS